MSLEEAIMPPVPMTPSTHSSLVSLAVESPKRRCSARLLSQSVQQTLRQLQKDEHEIRVAQLVKKNIKSLSVFHHIFHLGVFFRWISWHYYLWDISMLLFSILCLHCLVLWIPVLPHPQLPHSQHLPQPEHEGGWGGHPHVQGWQLLGVVQVWKISLSKLWPFFLPLFSNLVTFLPEGVIQGF